MPVIKPSCVRDVKHRVDLVEVISRVVTLRRAGSRHKGLCPFHQEKTPSFHVDPDKGFYKCFGCGKAGDAISFVRETEQLSFTEAVEALGQRFGIAIEYEEGAGPTREERSLRQELFDLHEVATEHFHQAFHAPTPGGEFMRRYWSDKRRFSRELADEFRIGAADAAADGLAAALMRRRYSEDALRQCGLFFIREGAVLTLGALRSRFRGRLMIPIRDHQGRVVAFTARQTEQTPEDDPAREAKYVNSPETPIFTKGHLLFNLDRAREAAGKENQPFLLVEGQLDALRCWSVGLRSAVAPQGTAITESQLVLLRRYQTRIDCLFDGDDAGQKAALRLLPLALKCGLEVRFLGGRADSKIDPDLLFLEKGAQGYEELRAASLSAMAFACRAFLPRAESARPEEKARAAGEVQRLVAQAESEVVRSQFLEEAAALLRIPAAALRRDFAARADRTPAAEPGVPARPPGSAVSAPPIPAERDLLSLCLTHEYLGKYLSRVVQHEWVDTDHPAGRLLNRFLAEFEQDNWPGRDYLDGLLETPEERALVASLRFDGGGDEDPPKTLSFALSKLRERHIRRELATLAARLAEAGEDGAAAPALRERQWELLRQRLQPIALTDIPRGP